MNIRELRAIKGLAQEKLGFEADVDRTLVSKIEREIANPTLEVLAKLCVCLEVPLGRLFDSPEGQNDRLGGGGLKASPLIVDQYPPLISGLFRVSLGV
jgi:transcriptional regulator with XRE-family HTH domain